MQFTRRQFLLQSAATGLVAPLLGCQSAPRAASPTEVSLRAAPAAFEILPGTQTQGFAFNGQNPAPVIRAKQGQPIRIHLHNQLSEPTTLHWHGLRIPVDMDGVPGTSQAPVLPGESFTYEFTPPDAGTFWYHPHINSIEQLGRGLVGAMVVEESEPLAFDRDEVLLLRNWQLNTDGSFGPLSIKRYAARQGTPGQTFSVNGKQQPSFRFPAGSSVRLRLLNADNTWHYELSLHGADAQLLAMDAHPIAPQPFATRLLGPGMRMDLGLLMPNTPGARFELKHRDRVLAQFEVGPAETPLRAELPRLPANPVSEPELEKATPYFFSFEWDAATDDQGRSLFWNIKGPKSQRPAFCANPNILASLEYGKSYVFTLRNNTQYPHPVHLHGHAFKVLESNKRSISPYFADTVILQNHEQVRIAFVADNPGAWMFHCHVLEHLVQGLAGMLVVV